MSLLRPAAAFSRLTARSLGVSRHISPLRPVSNTARYSVQGYGDSAGGGPKGDDPQAQGGSNDTKQHAEHPGPPPVAEGNNTGGATKGASKGKSKGKSPADASAQSGGSRSKEAKETGESPTGGKIEGGEGTSSKSKKSSGGSGKPRPKISDKATPGVDGESSEKRAEVEQHNKEFEKGHDRAPKASEG